MWILINEHIKELKLRGKHFALLGDKEKYTVGRHEDSDLVLSDTSVSRSHAFLYPTNDCVKLEDNQSRYGTFVNENINSKERVPNDEHIFLKRNDLVMFGGLGNAWRLKQIDLSVICTNVGLADQIELKTCLGTLHGNQISSEWSNSVTHVAMSSLIVTPKLLMALVNCVPVVSVEFFKKAIVSARDTGELPNEEDFIPSLSETSEVFSGCDFTVDEKRKTLFKGLNFIFLSENYFSNYHRVIESAGGACVIWDNKKASIIRVNSRVIVDHKDYSQQTELEAYLKTKNRRLILGSEIGFAIVHKSIDEYCNPKVTPKETQNILAEETPDIEHENVVKYTISEVPETLDLENAIKDHSKTILRVGDKTIPSNATEVPDSNPIAFPDDDDDEFELHSQAALKILEQSQVKSRKRRNSEEPEIQPSKRFSQSLSRAKTVDLSQFLEKSVQREKSPEPEPAFDVPAPSKRTLADLLEKDDDDDIFNFNTSKRQKSSSSRLPSLAETTNKSRQVPKIPSLIKTVKPESKDTPDAPQTYKITPVNITQMSGWLSRKMEDISLDIKPEPYDEDDDSKSWIVSLHNGFQIKEIRIDLTNITPKSYNQTDHSSTSGSGKKNFKNFRKQNYVKQDQTVKTVAVVLNGTI